MTPKPPLFLAPAPYRRRRLRDAARLLPILGAFLFLLPMLWGPGAAGARATGPDGLYLFAVWGILIAAARWLSARLSESVEAPAEDAED